MTKTSDKILYACATFHTVAGAVIYYSAPWTLLRMNYYFWTTDLGVELTSGFPLVVGGMLSVPVCLLFLFVPYYKKNFSLQAMLLVLVTGSLLLLSSGLNSLAGLSRTLHNTQAINASMLRALSKAGSDARVRRAFSDMQLELHCCGVQSHQDWRDLHNNTLPPSCCGRCDSGKELVSCETPLYADGCLHSALDELRGYTSSMSFMTLVVIVVTALSLLTTVSVLVLTSKPSCNCANCTKDRLKAQAQLQAKIGETMPLSSYTLPTSPVSTPT